MTDLQAQGSDVALHFTNLGCCYQVLHSKGIRASVVGQLGGGVSVCLRSLVGFDWGQDWDQFSEAVGHALWGRCEPLWPGPPRAIRAALTRQSVRVLQQVV